ncbi:hypothetical protein HYPSUDRAFT_218170 [Hypholoma sublateritium FD-334 SS-4]|uniref:Uncharacterized protein n=1 Tax=Hypholoma sublateritium (strain FD-334 SS-4) TaxID=945553 RepID=A0A0D2M5M8_HYPSF|nr:hypothetical protein HYPSUDRAFT_218170 [Hypholoma sublateritium FD-334 SS-4]
MLWLFEVRCARLRGLAMDPFFANKGIRYGGGAPTHSLLALRIPLLELSPAAQTLRRRRRRNLGRCRCSPRLLSARPAAASTPAPRIRPAVPRPCFPACAVLHQAPHQLPAAHVHLPARALSDRSPRPAFASGVLNLSARTRRHTSTHLPRWAPAARVRVVLRLADVVLSRGGGGAEVGVGVARKGWTGCRRRVFTRVGGAARRYPPLCLAISACARLRSDDTARAQPQPQIRRGAGAGHGEGGAAFIGWPQARAGPRGGCTEERDCHTWGASRRAHAYLILEPRSSRTTCAFRAAPPTPPAPRPAPRVRRSMSRDYYPPARQCTACVPMHIPVRSMTPASAVMGRRFCPWPAVSPAVFMPRRPVLSCSAPCARRVRVPSRHESMLGIDASAAGASMCVVANVFGIT